MMLEDFDLPGLDDLCDVIASLWDVLDLGADDLIDFEEPVLSLWPAAGSGASFDDVGAFWQDMDGPPLNAVGFGYEFGNMQFHNPFADGGLSSPIEDGSYDDFLARTSLSTGIPTSEFPQ